MIDRWMFVRDLEPPKSKDLNLRHLVSAITLCFCETVALRT